MTTEDKNEELSMEDILSSIKNILEVETAPTSNFEPEQEEVLVENIQDDSEAVVENIEIEAQEEDDDEIFDLSENMKLPEAIEDSGLDDISD